MVIRTRKIMAADLKPPITVQQWGELDGPPHYDLVAGHLIEIPEVPFWHAICHGHLTLYLHNFAKNQGLGMFIGPTAKLRMSPFGGRQPDLFFIPKDQFPKIGKNLFHGVPPLVIEILAPPNEETDRTSKRQEYAKLGVGQYWIIDFPHRRVEVNVLNKMDPTQREYRFARSVEDEAIFQSSLFPGLEIPLGEIWPTEFENRAHN